MENRTTKTTKHSTTMADDPQNGQGSRSLDVASLRLSQDFAASVGVKKLHTIIPVRKPNRQDFVRTHPDDAYKLETFVLEFKEEGETYIVDPALWDELANELKPVALFTTINRQGVLFLWAVPLPRDSRANAWHLSALDAAMRARTQWVRVSANMSLGAYEVHVAVADIPEPNWPELSMQEIVQTAFRERFIRSPDHPALKKLRGEV